MVPSAGSTPEDGCGTGPFVGRVAGLALAPPLLAFTPSRSCFFDFSSGSQVFWPSSPAAALLPDR
jgi:hypothetical protein